MWGIDEPYDLSDYLAKHPIEITPEMAAAFMAEHSTPCDRVINIRPMEPMDLLVIVRNYDVN